MTRPRCLLWDFGDTLCDERFIWASAPAWMALYETFEGGVGTDWCRGDLDTQGFAAAIAPRVGLTPEAALGYMQDRVAEIRWFPETFAFFRARHLPQAIVTVNPAFFTEVIVPAHGLDKSAAVVVTSAAARELDKGALCAAALAQLKERGEVPPDTDPGEALLIDNRQDCLDAWAVRGGRGYLHTGDAAFAADFAAGWTTGDAPTGN